MFQISVSQKRLQVKQVPSLKQLIARYPLKSVWERQHETRTIAYQIKDHGANWTTPFVLVEYQRWNAVWGWIPSGKFEWLEASLDNGQIVLHTYSDGYGFKAA